MADDSNPFAAPTKLSNVVLIVDGKKLHVYKELLAAHSDVFHAMFFGDFAENGKEEVEIKDVVFEEFVDLLNTIDPKWKPITATTVSHILKLADRFQIMTAREQAEHFLLMTSDVVITTKLLIADQYNLQRLKTFCLNSITCPMAMHTIKSHSPSGYALLSDDMKAAICDRMMELEYCLTYNCNDSMADDSNPFAAPTKLSNVVLIVDGKKLHVNKELLASHSHYFYTMFFGEFAEKGKEEVEIKDVVFGVTASVVHIMKLADQFQMEDAWEQAEKFLMKTRKVTTAAKLALADQYNLHKIRDLCLNSITCINDMYPIKASFARLSDTMKAAICNRLMEFITFPAPRYTHSVTAVKKHFCNCN